MMPERSPERDAAIMAMLPLVPLHGWTLATLTEAAGRNADLLFPGGASDMAEAYADLGDRQMEEDAAASDMTGLRVPARVRAVIAARLKRQAPYKEAVRRAVGVMAMPGRVGVALRATARTVDSVWHAAGDTSVDFSWYTKRAILAGVYTSTVLYWLQDTSDGDEDTLAFLDRRLADVARLGRRRRAS